MGVPTHRGLDHTIHIDPWDPVELPGPTAHHPSRPDDPKFETGGSLVGTSGAVSLATRSNAAIQAGR